MATKNIFGDIDPFLYKLDVAPSIFSLKEARAEYVRLAKIANKRIKRLQQSPDFGTAKAAQHALFGPIGGVKSERRVYAMLADVAAFTERKTSSLSGLRAAQKAQLETMRERGYTWLNKNNIQEFGKFWKEVKKHGEYKNYASDRIADLFRQAKRKRIDSQDLAKDFEYWLQHEEDLDDMKRSNETISSAYARERIPKK